MMIRTISLLSVLLAAQPASAAAATLQLAPPSVPPGAVATAYGFGFCDEEACSPVTLRMAGQVVDSGIPVRPGGSFEAPVRTEKRGRFEVTATQRLADGSTLSASATLIVGGGDRPVDPTVEPTEEPTTATPVDTTPSPPGGETPTSASPFSPGSTAEPDATPSGGSRPHPLAWVLLAVLGAAGAAALWRWISARR